jgi:hypothetical protein
VADLVAGYAHRRRGVSSYVGVLKQDRKSAPVWACTHDHLTTVKAAQCAEAELERRAQGGREVFELLHCTPCSKWWSPEEAGTTPPGGTECPRCGVPLEMLKLAVLERTGPS